MAPPLAAGIGNWKLEIGNHQVPHRDTNEKKKISKRTHLTAGIEKPGHADAPPRLPFAHTYGYAPAMFVPMDLMTTVWLASLPAMLAPPGAPKLREHSTKYYTIYSDLDERTVREAALRVTVTFEEYVRRTSGFTGRIEGKLPFALFAKPEDYFAAGGVPGSAGAFLGDRLMAHTGGPNSRPWATVQHEGFHQFVHAVIGGDMPVWVNEGMAEYFGDALFTGDRLVAGIVPQERLERVRRSFAGNEFRSLPDFMTLGQAEWNGQMSRANYDQAWSMVYFLAHADNGAYQPRFDEFLRNMGRKGWSWEQAWIRSFGSGIADFDRRWKAYWLNLPENPTADLYAECTVQTLTAYLGRAYTQGRTFPTMTDFAEAGRVGDLTYHPEDWLPHALFAEAWSRALTAGRWSLQTVPRKPPELICELPDGATLTGTCVVSGGRVKHVSVRRTSPIRRGR